MERIVPSSTYLLVYLALIALTLLTTGVAFIDLGPFNTVVAIIIAFAKMSLVVAIFMHLRHSPALTRLVLVAGLFWLALLICLTETDYKTRSWTPAPQPWSASAPPTHP